MAGLGLRLRWIAGVLLLLTGVLVFGQYEDPETAMRRADTALGQGRFDVAQLIYDRTLRSNPTFPVNSWRCRNIAEANIRATRSNLASGAEWMQKAVDQAPDDVSSRERLAEVLLRASQPTKAAAQYRTLLKKDPQNQQYILGLAQALRESGQYDDSATLLWSTLREQPGYVSLRVEYGRILAYQHDYEAAKKQYQEALKTEPQNLEAQVGLAKVYSWQGNQQQALVQYEKALVRDPGNYDALVGQAFALIWSGRQNEALPILERANSRHPEDAEVRDALKKLGGVNIFTGEVRAGEPQWPVLSPSTRKPPEKSAKGTTEESPAVVAPPGANSAQSAATQPSPEGSQANPAGTRSNMWVVGMGLTVLVAVFAIVAFVLFILPSKKKAEAAKAAAESRPRETSFPEQWTRLEQLARPTQEDQWTWKRPEEPAKPLPISELLPPPKPSDPVVETEAAPLAEMPATAPASPEPSSLETEPGIPRLPRRRRGTSDRPWWRELPSVETTSAEKTPPEAPAKNTEPEPAIERPPAPAPEEVIDRRRAPAVNPYLDLSAPVVVPKGAINPLTPASERPREPEEPPPARPFTVVLSRALERAGDGHLDESAPDEHKPSLPAEDFMPTKRGNGSRRRQTTPVTETQEPVTSQALSGANIVIVGCGVMVSHYRGVLRAAGADVRIFTFWDLAMTSMRKRRADVLLIDGDTLDGLTPSQMYTSAQIERYMFGAILVGISSDEDRTLLKEDVVLAHSLSDSDLVNRLVDAVKVS